MRVISTDHRNQLARVILQARREAEAGARKALAALAVDKAKPFDAMTEEEKALRRRLRAHGRQLGDRLDRNTGEQQIDHLVHEVAYEHWHRMLFARFLAENHLLMEPEAGVAISMEECQELAREQGVDPWALAGRYAARMLPRIFRPDDPALEVTLAPEARQALEILLETLPAEVFTADDALGWTYQFWQAEKKDEVNKSGEKIGADELPAVTQLFTEHYMVQFLFHNTLGAWHAAKVLARRPELAENAADEEELRRAVRLSAAGGYDFDYLRFVDAASSRVDIKTKPLEAASTLGYFDKEEPVANLSGNLPHWRQEGVTYFVTFRMADSLPQEKLKQWQAERESWLREHPEPHDEATRREYYKRFPERLQTWLDAGHGECLLARPEYKAIVEDALKYFDGDRYDLDEFVVMPNHVHVLVTPKAPHGLTEILHSWKSYTAGKINKIHGRKGTFWQKESFDHIVRSPEQAERIRRYIREHPVDAASSRVYIKKRQDAASTLWRPAAGAFEGWPKRAAELKVLDPCCGSGHFLVEGLHILVRLRMEEEGLELIDAIRAVLADNLFGLEIDPRCTQIAAFSLALAAWKLMGKPVELPALNIACSGLPVAASQAEWLKLAGGDNRLEVAMEQLHELFRKAPELGSLIDPAAFGGDLIQAGFGAVRELLGRVLDREDDIDAHERAVAARGMARAAELLADWYTLVITNVPYLARGKQSDTLRKFADDHHPAAKQDLATIFLSRFLTDAPSRVDTAYSRVDIKTKRLEAASTLALVMPQNWLFLTSYKKLREKLLEERTWNLVARLGPRAFETIGGEVVNVALEVISADKAEPEWRMGGIDASKGQSPQEKAALLRGIVEAASSRLTRQDAASTLAEKRESSGWTDGVVRLVAQQEQLANPDSRITLSEQDVQHWLYQYALGLQGVSPADAPYYSRCFWEILKSEEWRYWQSSIDKTCCYGGRELVLWWNSDLETSIELGNAYVRGKEAWKCNGIVVKQMGELPSTIYSGEIFDTNVAVILPKEAVSLDAIWCYCSSQAYADEVRKVDQKLNVTNATLVKVPFDLFYWKKKAAKNYPHGLPDPQSNDPTQWLFHGHPAGMVAAGPAERSPWGIADPIGADRHPSLICREPNLKDVLQVAVARLLGYRWPAEVDAASSRVYVKKRQDAASTAWLERCKDLDAFTDEDGIVALSPVHGERSAADRLRALLAAAFGDAWYPARERELLQAAAGDGKPAASLEEWLRDRFFEEHCKLFHHRPFIWHIWDGRKDGFHVLVNYHRLAGVDAASSRVKRQDGASTLARRTLEAIAYSYLGEWIERQKREQQESREGADARLAAALDLQAQLEKILGGEPPYDIFVRWKPLHEQPIGWDPDINDGVRLNIRPFMTVELRKGGRKGAGCLRWKPNIKWSKDRGKEPQSLRPKEDFPWFWSCPGDDSLEERTDFMGDDTFDGNRWNDLHYTNANKRAARERKAKEEKS